jgi:hypothetical protein
MAGLFKTLGHVPTQGDVERLAEDPDPGPFASDGYFLALRLALRTNSRWGKTHETTVSSSAPADSQDVAG